MKGKHLTQKELPLSERPYEKAVSRGIGTLTDGELLAVIIRTGTNGRTALEVSRDVLSLYTQYPGLLGIYHAGLKELTSIDGIGRVKAVQLQAVGELSKRMARATRPDFPVFRSPEEIAAYYMESMRHQPREQLLLGMVNGRNQLIADTILSSGTVNSSPVSPREIFLTALAHEAVSVFLIHNHPSGDPEPSRDDILITRRLREAGNMLDIHLLDHIIIGDNRFVSLKTSGIL